MFVNSNILLSNPFFDSYYSSDFLGKLIIIFLIILSIITWVILIHKGWILYQLRQSSVQIKKNIYSKKSNILNVDIDTKHPKSNPFFNLYTVLKKQTIEILNKNRRFGQEGSEDSNRTPYLSPADIDIVGSHLSSTIASQTKEIDKNLFILATIISLAPFLGLLGTVWGILTTFSQLQAQTMGNTNQMVIGGLSLALATTVIGLVDAIPALIGYNYFKNSVRDLQTEMECFSSEMLSAVEMQYRKVDVQ
jgi:biopolymer transport protein TolQ